MAETGGNTSEQFDHLLVFVAYGRDRGEDVAGASALAELRHRLPPLNVTPWVDTDLVGGEGISDGVEAKIDHADVMLYVLTLAAVRKGHPSRGEIARAKLLGIPVIVIQAEPNHPRLIPPVWLQDHVVIRCSPVDGESGWIELAGKLRHHASLEGRISRVEMRLERLLDRASLDPSSTDAFDDDASRLEDDLAALRRQAADPSGAARRQRERIKAAKEDAREPRRRPPHGEGMPRVGEPPPIPPGRFRDRGPIVADLELRLAEPRFRLVSLVGRPEGIGKTAMIRQLWDRMLSGDSPMRVDGLVFLTGLGFWAVNAEAVIDALVRMVPDPPTAARLERDLQRPMPWVERLATSLEALGERSIIVVIDAVEEMIDLTGEVTDPHLREVLDNLVGSDGHGVRLLVVGRREAEGLVRRAGEACYRSSLTEGLPAGDAFDLLRMNVADSGQELAPASKHDMAWLREMTDGSPRALELASGILTLGGNRSLTALLDLMQALRRGHDGEDMVRLLFSRAFARLGTDARVVQALAIYGRPVPPAAVDHLLKDYVPGVESARSLERLSLARLVRHDADDYYVPPTPESDYVLGTLPAGRPGDGEMDSPPFTRTALLHHAAGWFAASPVEEPTGVADLRAPLSEIDLRVQAGEYPRAFDLMGKLDDDYLLGWGYSGALLPLLQKMLASDELSTSLRIQALSLLARVLYQLEEYADSLRYAQHALELASGPRQTGNRAMLRRQILAASLSEDGRYAASAGSLLLPALADGRPSLIAGALSDHGMCLALEGRLGAAGRWLRGATWLAEGGGRSPDTPSLLITRVWYHRMLGDHQTARTYLKKAATAASDLRDQLIQGRCLLHEAELLIDEGMTSRSIDRAAEAAAIGLTARNHALCRDAKEVEALACLIEGRFDDAAAACDVACRHRCGVHGHGMRGLVALRRGKEDQARAAFREGNRLALSLMRPAERNFVLLDSHGLVAGGLALLKEDEFIPISVNSFSASRGRTNGRAKGAMTRNLLLLDQFGPHADGRVLAKLQTAIRGGGQS